MPVLRIIREERKAEEGLIVDLAVLELDGKSLGRLWFRFPGIHEKSLSENLDHFVVGTLFRAMEEGADIKAEGPVSPSLLRNLQEFTAAWAHWLPGKYHDIAIEAGIEREPVTEGREGAVSAFSGGVDAAFTMYRHHKGLAGRLSRKVSAGMMAHGFDIPLDEPAIFDKASGKSLVMVESLGLELVPVSTNFREINGIWNETHGAAVASCLMLLQGRYSSGLIGSTEPYNALILPWGSNPITDPLLGSDSFEIVHDGAAFTRSEKIAVIADWQEALTYLRVCWQGEIKDRNCGTCEKCIRTILNFRLLGRDLPGCFEKDASDSDILRLKGLTPVPIAYLEEILESARMAGIDDPWVSALRLTIARNRRAATGWRKQLRLKRNELSLGNKLKNLFNGGRD
jgi:hypothetical protein